MRRHLGIRLASCLAALATLDAACSSAHKPVGSTTTRTPAVASTKPAPVGSSSPTTVVSAADDWVTYQHDPARSGVAGGSQGLSTRLSPAWQSPELDAEVYAQPLEVGGRVIVATEGNSVYAFDATTGSADWHASLGEPVSGASLPCGNIDPSGVTGTPVADPSAGVVYVVTFLRAGPHHELFALDIASGAVRWHRAIDPPGLSPRVEQQRGALALIGGRVYVPFGGLYGDCGAYKGAVVSTPADGSGADAAYVVDTPREAGIWNPAGVVVDDTGDLLVTTGNAASTGAFAFGNALVRLTSTLGVRDWFAPTDWAALDARDADLGSLGPALLPGRRAMVVGKSGVAYLVNRDSLGHVSDALSSVSVCRSAFGAAAVLGSTALVPCNDALVAVQVAGDRLTVAWRNPGGSGPPVVAAGLVWTLKTNGSLVGLDPVSGNERASETISAPVTRFASLSAARGRLFVTDGSRVTTFSLST